MVLGGSLDVALETLEGEGWAVAGWKMAVLVWTEWAPEKDMSLANSSGESTDNSPEINDITTIKRFLGEFMALTA